MKLHLPTRLRSAVLACITAIAAVSTTVATGVFTGGVVTYALAGAQAFADDVVFGGTIYTATPGANNYLHGCTFNETTYADGKFTVTETTAAWSPVCASDDYNTLRFTTSESTNTAADVQFNTLKISGVVVEAGSSINSIGSAGDRSFLIGKAETTSNSIISKDFGLSASNSITLSGNQTWTVAADKTFTVQANNGITSNATMLKIAGAGTVNMSSALTLNGSLSNAGTVNMGGALTLNGTLTNAGALILGDVTCGETGLLSNSGALTLNGKVNLRTPIMNSGTVGFGENVVFDLTNMVAEDGVYTLFATAVDLTSLNEGSHLVAPVGYSYTFRDDGTVLATVSSRSLVWNGGTSGNWDDDTKNWKSGQTDTDFEAMDSVTFNTAGAQVTVVGDKEAINMTINAATSLSGAATVSVSALAGSAQLGLGENTKLVVTDSAAGVALSGAGTLQLSTENGAFSGSIASDWTGKVTLTSGEAGTIRITNLNLNNYGREGSSVELKAVTGYLNGGGGTYTPNLVITNSDNGAYAGLEITDGSSTPTYTFAGSISGSGNWVNTFNNGTQNYVFNGDMSQWTGKLSQMRGTMNVTMNGTHWAGNLEQTGGTLNATINGEAGAATVGSITLGGGEATINGDKVVHTGSLVLSGSTLTVNTDIEVAGEFSFAQGGSSAGKNHTIADGKSITAATMTSQWGANLNLGAGSALNVTGVAAFSPGGAERIFTGAEDGTSVIRVGGLSNNNYGNTKFRNLTVEIGASGITQTSSANRFAFDNTKVVAAADFTTSSANATSGVLELVNGVTFDTHGHVVTIGSTLTGSGTLTKIGAGTLALNGTNSFTGAVTIQAGTLKLFTQLGCDSLVNNGTLEIGSGFSGIEGSGRTAVSGGADGNGFMNGGSGNIFATSGTVTGTKTALFNGKSVALGNDGSFTVGADWGTYYVDAALSSAETFGAIKGKADASGGTLQRIVFNVASQNLSVNANGLATSMIGGTQANTATLTAADGVTITVDSATMPAITVDGEGSSLTLNMAASSALNLTGASTLHVTGTGNSNVLNLGNGTMARELTITNASVSSSHSGGTGFNTGTTQIGAGGKLILTAATDALGYNAGAAGTITLAGTAASPAIMELGGRATLSTNIVMQGNSRITASASPAGTGGNAPALDPYGGTLTVDGTNNVISCGIRNRRPWNMTINEGAELTVDGTNFTLSGEGSGQAFVKLGAGTVMYKNVTGMLRGYSHEAGTSVFDGAVLTVQTADFSLSNNSASGKVRFVKGADVTVNSNLQINSSTSVEVDDASALKLHRNDYDLTISGAAGKVGVMTGTGEGAAYDLNAAATFSNAKLTLTSTAEKTIASKLDGGSVVVNAGDGALTVSHADVTALAGVTAQGGNVTLSALTSVGDMTIAAGKSVTASAAGALSITSSLTAGGGSSLSTELTLGNGIALDLATGSNALNLGGNALTLGTGLTITEAMMSAITALEAEQTLTLMKGVTSLTGGSRDATEVFSGLEGDYSIGVEDGNLVINAAALPSAVLSWLGGDGVWGGESTPWTDEESQASAYVDNAVATIGSAETTGGTITVQGELTAKSVTIAGSDYIIKAANGASLSIKQDLVVNENVATSLQFLPTVGGGIVVNRGASLDATAVSINRDSLGTLLDKTTGNGTLLVTGGKEFMLKKSLTVSTNLDVTGKFELNANQSSNATVTVGNGASLTVHGGALILESTAGLVVNGGKVDAQDGITLGHAEAGHPGHLSMSGGEIKTTTINLRDNRTANTVNITGGKLIVTGANAFTGTGTATTVAISNATLTNGETDMAFNHASTLTDTTVQANADTKITVGGEGLTTTLAGKLTTKGTTELVGTMSTAGLTGLVNSGDLTVKADTISVAGLDNTGTMTVEGKLVVSGGTAKGGTVSATDVELGGASTFTKLTATGTVSGSAMLTVGDGSSIGTLNNGKLTVSAGTVEVANATTLNQLVNNGTLTVGGALSLTGNVTTGGNISATSLSLSGNGTKLSGTTLQTGTINIGSLDHNAPLTLGTLTAAGTGVQFNVTQADLESKGNGSTTTLAVLNTAYGSGLTLNGTEASVTYGGITYTIGLSDDGKNILVTGEGSGGWQSTDGKWTSSSSWGDGEPGATDTAYFFGEGTASVELDGDQTVGSVVISSKTDGTSSVDDYTFSGDKLTVNGDVQVDHGSLTIENEVTAQNLVLNKRGSSSDSSSFAIGESGKLSVGDIAFNGIDATIANAGEIVISGAADFAMTGGGSVEVAEGGDVTLQGDTTAASVVNSGTTSVTGTLAADSVESSGMMEIGADLAATSVENSGTMTVTGSVAADSVENTGTMSIGGDVASSAVTSTDTMTVTGGVTADSVENSGTMSIGGDVAAAAVTSTDKMTVTGCLTSDSVTNGGTMEIGTDVNAENGLVDNGGSLTVGGNMIAAGTQNAAGAAMAVTGDMNVGSMQNMGTTKVDGNLVAGTFSNGGTVTVKGSAALTESTDNGGTLSAASADLAGGDTFTRLKVTGTVKTPGSLAVGNGSSMGKLDGDSLTINGTGANVSIGSDTTLTELNSEGTLNLGKKALTLNGSGNTAGSVKAGSITVNGTDNTFGDMSGTDLTLNATGTTVNDLSINSILFNDLTGVDADTAAMTMTGTLNTDAETVMVYLGESVISSLLSTTGEYKLIGGDAVVKDDFTLDEAAVQAFYSVAKTVSLQQGSLMLVVDDMSLADRVWNVGSTTSSAGLEISPDGMHIETPAVLGTIQNVHVAGTKTLDVTDMTDGTLAVRNLTGDAASELTIKGAPSKQVALLVNDNSRAYASKGSLRSLVLDGATASVAQEDGSSAKLSVTDNVTLTNGSKLSISNAALRTGALNAEDAAAGSLSGTVEITGKGGVFNGAYGKDAAFKLASGASQKLVASDKVAVLGSGTASVMKDAAGNKNLREVSMQGGQLVLGNMTDTTLGITEASSVTDGTVAMKLRTDSMDDGNSGAVIDAPAMDLTGTTLQIGQADKATTMKVATGSAKNILATLPEGTMPEAVVLEGATLNKYFASATVNADGTVTGNRNTTYFTGTVVPEVTEANTAAGMEMLDAALVELNPQVTAPEGALAGIMNALEQHADVDTDRLGAAVAGSGLAGLSMAAAGDVERQLRAIRNRTTTMGVDQCVVNEELPYVNAWANAEGDYTKLNSDSMMPGYTMSSWGATVGMDVDCTPHFTCGLAVTAMYGKYTSSTADNVDAELSNYYLSAFARYTRHRWTHTAVATFGLSDYDVTRNINYGIGNTEITGNTNGSSFGAMYELGYVVALGENGTTCLQPVVNVNFRHVSVGGYAENSSDAALTVDDMDANIVTFGMGARLQSVVGENLYNRSSIFECRAMLKLDAGDTQGEAKTALRGVPGTHTVKSAEMGKFGVEFGAGVTVPVGQDSGSIFVDASAEFRSGYTGVNGTVGYRVNF